MICHVFITSYQIIVKSCQYICQDSKIYFLALQRREYRRSDISKQSVAGRLLIAIGRRGGGLAINDTQRSVHHLQQQRWLHKENNNNITTTTKQHRQEKARKNCRREKNQWQVDC